MYSKNIHIIAGLPRSGSTILCNILNQNPEFYASSTSGVLELIVSVKNDWENVNLFKSSPNPKAKDAVLGGILNSYYSVNKEHNIFDKSRGWIAQIDLLEMIIQKKAKILFPVRNIVDILSSFEKLYRGNAHNWACPQEKQYPLEWQTVKGRCSVYMQNDQAVGSIYNGLNDAFLRGYSDRIKIIEYEKFTKNPEMIMRGVYDFLEIEYYPHYFTNIIHTNIENDYYNSMPNMHDTHKDLNFIESDASEILGKETVEYFTGFEFWRK